MVVVVLGSCSEELHNVWSLGKFDQLILTLDTPVHVYLLVDDMINRSAKLHLI